MIRVRAARVRSLKSAMEPKPIIGNTYRHYKGNNYTVIALVKNSETLEEMVVYQAQYGEKQIWVRPLKMFIETVTIDGNTVDRFTLIK